MKTTDLLQLQESLTTSGRSYCFATFMRHCYPGRSSWEELYPDECFFVKLVGAERYGCSAAGSLHYSLAGNVIPSFFTAIFLVVAV